MATRIDADNDNKSLLSSNRRKVNGSKIVLVTISAVVLIFICVLLFRRLIFDKNPDYRSAESRIIIESNEQNSGLEDDDSGLFKKLKGKLLGNYLDSSKDKKQDSYDRSNDAPTLMQESTKSFSSDGLSAIIINDDDIANDLTDGRLSKNTKDSDSVQSSILDKITNNQQIDEISELKSLLVDLKKNDEILKDELEKLHVQVQSISKSLISKQEVAMMQLTIVLSKMNSSIETGKNSVQYLKDAKSLARNYSKIFAILNSIDEKSLVTPITNTSLVTELDDLMPVIIREYKISKFHSGMRDKIKTYISTVIVIIDTDAVNLNESNIKDLIIMTRRAILMDDYMEALRLFTIINKNYKSITDDFLQKLSKMTMLRDKIYKTMDRLETIIDSHKRIQGSREIVRDD